MPSASRFHRPLIGVTVSAAPPAAPSQDVEKLLVAQRYLDVLWRAGACPVTLPYTTDAAKLAAFCDALDGFLFAGGGDIHPAYYGAPPDPRMDISPARDAFEAALFHVIFPTGKPILGICRGLQVLNVLLGGTLWAHLDGHAQTLPGLMRPQTVDVVTQRGSLLYRLCRRKTLQVNTYHHQAIRDLAPALRVDATASDGVIEAVHAPDHPFLLGVQFHPECYAFAADDDHGAALFEAFADAAAGAVP